MKTNGKAWQKSWLGVALMVVILGLVWNAALGAPADPALEVTPGQAYDEIDGGGTATYHHVITNTGDVTGSISLTSLVPDGWEAAYATADQPQGTTIWLPVPLPPSATLPVTVYLTAPSSARSGRYTSTITVTLRASPTVEIPVYEVTDIRTRFIYLPLVLRNYAPFVNGSFEAGLTGWTASESPLPVSLVDAAAERGGGNTPGDGAQVVLLGKTDYDCYGVPVGFAAVEQTFVVSEDASTLMFDYVVWSEDVSVSQKFDRFEVYLWKTIESMPASPVYHDGNQAPGIGCGLWRRVPETGWKTGSIDLAPYRGQMVTLSFRNYSRYDNKYNTYTYLDNVKIQ